MLTKRDVVRLQLVAPNRRTENKQNNEKPSRESSHPNVFLHISIRNTPQPFTWHHISNPIAGSAASGQRHVLSSGSEVAINGPRDHPLPVSFSGGASSSVESSTSTTRSRVFFHSATSAPCFDISGLDGVLISQLYISSGLSARGKGGGWRGGVLWLEEGFPGGELENGLGTTGGMEAERIVPDGESPGRKAALAMLEEGRLRKLSPSGMLEKTGARGFSRALPT